MKQPYVNFRELKAAVPIRRVLERYGLLESLKERGDALSGPCPFCEGETSFRANTEKNCFHCFGCKAGGNMLDLVAAKEDCPVRDAAVKVAEWFGIESSRPDRKAGAAAKQTRPEEKAPAGEAGVALPPEAGKEREAHAPVPAGTDMDSATHASAVPAPNPPLTFELKLDPDNPWFAEAGIRPETVAEFGLGFCSKGMMAGRIAFPLRDAEGRLLGYAGLWPGKDLPEGRSLWKYPSGLDLARIVFPADKLRGFNPDTALLARDPLQVVLAWQLGLEGVVHLPAGGFTDGTMRTLQIAFG